MLFKDYFLGTKVFMMKDLKFEKLLRMTIIVWNLNSEYKCNSTELLKISQQASLKLQITNFFRLGN